MKKVTRNVGKIFLDILLAVWILLVIATVIMGGGLIIGKAFDLDAFILGAFTNILILLLLPVVVHLALVVLDLFLLLKERYPKGWMRTLQICMFFFGIVSMIEAGSFFFVFELLTDLDSMTMGILFLHSFWVFAIIHAVVEVVLWIADRRRRGSY